MKVLRQLGCLLLLLLGLLGSHTARAQIFALSVSNSPNSLLAGSTLNYTINVTNLTFTGDVFVTNYMPTNFTFVTASNSFFAGPGGFTNSPGQVAFELGAGFLPGNFATLTFSIIPTAGGPFTNLVEVGSFNFTNVFAAVTNVTFVGTPTASLGMNITGPSNAVLAGDTFTYSVTVTNTGTNTVNNVVLTNTLPAGVGLVGVMPTNPPYTLTNGVMAFNLGSIAAAAADNFFFTVTPTNAGALSFIASAGAFRATNVTVTNIVTVSPFDTTQLLATNFSAMTFNLQNGLMEQFIQLSNIGTNTNAGARVIVSGLADVLFDAAGTNNGSPYVEYDAPLPPSNSVNLVLQYFVPARQPITVSNSAYAAVPLPVVNVQPPPGTPVPVTLTNLHNGTMLIEFQSTLGHTYTIIYSDNPQMSNALAAQPQVVAPADRTQWMDEGPPLTTNLPTNVSMRFYSVLFNH